MLKKLTFLTLALFVLGGCSEKQDISVTDKLHNKSVEITQSSNEEKFTSKEIGEQVDMTAISYRINKVTESKEVTAEYLDPKKSRNKAKYIIVDMTVINNKSSDYSFDPKLFFKLIDKENKNNYSPDFEASSYDYKTNLYYKSLSPALENDGIIVFEIPENIEAYGLLALDEAKDLTYYTVLRNP